MLAGARPDVDDVVGLDDGRLVVLDDDQRVPQIAKPDQGVDQPPVVSLVQADRGLVQDVQHPDEPAADLRGQPDALGLAAGKRAGGAAQRQVVEADVDQEAEPRADLLQRAAPRSCARVRETACRR